MAEKGEEKGEGKEGDLEEEEGRKGVETDSQVVEEGGGRRKEGEMSMVEGGKLPGKVFLGLEVHGWVCTPVFFLPAL